MADYYLWKMNRQGRYLYAPLLALDGPSDDVDAVLRRFAGAALAADSARASPVLRAAAQAFTEMCDDYGFRDCVLDDLPLSAADEVRAQTVELYHRPDELVRATNCVPRAGTPGPDP